MIVKAEKKETHNRRRLHWVWLAETCGAASREFRALAERYEDPYDLYAMPDEEIERLEGISEGLKLRLCNKSLDAVWEIIDLCDQKGFRIVSFGDGEYPKSLRTLKDPPAVLYVQGSLPKVDERLCVGMVGTRKMSPYGRSMAYRLSYDLSAAGAVVVSGLALGIDGVSACGALTAGGTTVAVLGCGLLADYPKAHRKLRAAIAQRGAVVTEYPPSTPPVSYNFPTRNRIISGLCQGTLLVEGALRSGSMITARATQEQGRNLFAVPGKVGDENSSGTNALIREGAYVVLTAEDVLGKYELLYHDALNMRAMTEARKECPAEARALERYGVPAEYGQGRAPHGEKQAPPRREESPPATASLPVKEKTRAPRKEATTPTEESESLTASLDPLCRRVLERMPMDRPVTPDALVGDGCGISEVISALTLLEIRGLIRSLPGGMYLRA